MLSIPVPNLGRYWIPGGRVNSGGPERGIGDDVLRFRPFFVTREVRLDRLAVKTDGTGRDNTIRLGIYDSDANGLPAGLLIETGDMNTNGDGSGTVKEGSFLMPASLFPGRLYYTAIISRREGAETLDTNYTVTSIGGASGALTLGGVTQTEALDASNDFGSLEITVVGWTAMPNPVVVTSPVFSNMPPAIAGRVQTSDFAGEGPGHAPFVYPWGATEKRWYIAGGINRDTATQTLTAGTVAYIPFFTSFQCDVDALAFQVTTAQAGALVRLGIYDDVEGVGGPGALLGESASIDAGTTGVKEEAITPITLLGKRTFWAAIGYSGTAGLAIRALVISSGQPMVTNLGLVSATNATGNTLPDAQKAQATGFVAGTGLSDPAPGGLTYNNARIRAVAFRIFP